MIRDWSKKEHGELGLFSLANRGRMGRIHLRGYYREDRATLRLEVNRGRNEGQWAQTVTKKTLSGQKEKNYSSAARYD